ncbi:hypothetical protein B0T24DRAFT_218533 [Lasiosphaeria ovina]|uniref:Ubiquitin 3 binding protein But2 C-terminal domain-containing protein n=1 Tax=Lasiosphaeria ovina TaxID=92902 RepID=A0AAE0KGL1_9PEZI|nr:hypothetical protein B0T24DRAFT_218533 [Lasiosphaeria ovina]
MVNLLILYTRALGLGLTLLATAASAASAGEPISARQCTTTIVAPSDVILFDMWQPPTTPGTSFFPFFEAALNADGTGYRSLVRFTNPAPPSTGTCAWVLSLPAAEFGHLILQGLPADTAPVLLAFYGVDPAAPYAPGDGLAGFALKPGPYGVNAIHPGTQVIHAEPCAQIGTDVFVRIPEWITEAQWVFWRQDIQPGNATASLGLYLQVQQC